MVKPFNRACLAYLRCPKSGEPLTIRSGYLVSEKSAQKYRIDVSGIPMFAENLISRDAEAQQQHYDKIVDTYVTNLNYPHTQEYTAYLDQSCLGILDNHRLGEVAEICCGRGEAARAYTPATNAAKKTLTQATAVE